MGHDKMMLSRVSKRCSIVFGTMESLIRGLTAIKSSFYLDR